jgi:hypothetical protein
LELWPLDFGNDSLFLELRLELRLLRWNRLELWLRRLELWLRGLELWLELHWLRCLELHYLGLLELHRLRLLKLYRLDWLRCRLELRLRLSKLLLGLLKLCRLRLLLLEWRVKGKLDILDGNLHTSVALRNAVIERGHEKRWVRIAWVGCRLLLPLRGTNVGHVKLLASSRLGVVGWREEDVIRSIRSWWHPLQVHK